MRFLIQTKSWSSAWNRLSTVSKLNQVISQRVLSGTITGEDYDTVLIPAIKDKLKSIRKFVCSFKEAGIFHI